MPIKRVSPFTSRKLKASMTVEAAFVLPLFLFFLINILSIINMIGTQSRFHAALHQVGNRMAFAGYAYDKTAGAVLPDEIVGAALTEVYARNQILDYVEREYLEKSCIQNKAAGVRFDKTRIMSGDDMIEIHVSYCLEPLISIPGFEGVRTGGCYYGHAWTGYDVEKGVSDLTEEDPMVYITDTGTVYHTNRNCTYLNPSIETVDFAEVDGRRNQSGGKYYPCERCGRGTIRGAVYITGQGSSYHASITCSGLKRTIYTIPLSQAGGRGRCSKCR
ncbi:MAG: hypothetical protein NC419_07385 [Muribaculaceae bacterium]|nr:hypothetical protein [Muribaculaceae bacterium]